MAFELPQLPYDFSALEPHIDAKTMEIHHGKHHNAYVTNLNKAVEGSDLEGKSLDDLMKNISSAPAAVRNHGGGHYDRSLCWTGIGPNGGGGPSGELAEAINSKFGSFAACKEEFDRAAATRFGSGWAWLSVDGSGQLQVSSTPTQDSPVMDV